MPYTAKEREVLAKLKKQYGAQKGLEMYYKLESAGKLKAKKARDKR